MRPLPARAKALAHRQRGSRPVAQKKRWSGQVTRTSNALDLEPGVFTLRSARAIAASLQRSALKSKRRKTTPFQSAMSMLNFEINRAGRGMSATRNKTLERAKVELRRAFGRAEHPASR